MPRTDTSEIKNHASEDSISRIDTNSSVLIPKDVFEKLYLTPKLPVKGDLRRTFANPTPLGLLGFVMTTTPLACQAMGWRGAAPAASLIGVDYFFGGMLQIIACIMEFVLGNTFPCVIFGSFGCLCLVLGLTNEYVIPAAKDPAEFYSSFAFFLVFFGLLNLFFLMCSLRTNVVFVCTFTFIVAGVSLLAAAYWSLAEGELETGEHLLVGAGACVFVFSMCGWYLLLGMVLEAVDFPLTLPVGDLSTRFRGKRARQHQSGELRV